MKRKTWGNMYGRPMGLIEFIRSIILHFKYLCMIIFRRARRCLEVGTGRGAQSIFLSYFMPYVVALDSDKNVIKNAMSNVKRFRGIVQLVVADAFHLPFRKGSFDASYSQGLLEHFSDEQACQIVKEQLIVSSYVINSLPSDHYIKRFFGDERLLSPSVWDSILKKHLVGDNLIVRVRWYFPLIKWHVVMTIMKDHEKRVDGTNAKKRHGLQCSSEQCFS